MAKQDEGREPGQPEEIRGDAAPAGEQSAKPAGEGKPPREAKPRAEGQAAKGGGSAKDGKGAKEGKPGKEGKAPKDKGGKDKGAKGGPPAEPEIVPVPRMKIHYEQEVVPALRKRFGYANKHQIPRLEKIVINMGVGDALTNPRFLDAAAEDLGSIAGQRPAIRRARKSIANFKLREGVAIGTMVTLRGPRMFEFLDRLINVAVPRIRDFRGLSSRGFDGRGNYSFGIKEQIIFPEIKYDKVEKIRGMDVIMVTTARTDEEGLELLKAMRMPFRER